MMSRQPLATTDGFTQAESVIAVVSRSPGASVIVTVPLPLNSSALPNLPAVVHVAFVIAPALPWPDAAAVAAAAPSSVAVAAAGLGVPAAVVAPATGE